MRTEVLDKVLVTSNSAASVPQTAEHYRFSQRFRDTTSVIKCSTSVAVMH
jgi:hypothetical protein